MPLWWMVVAVAAGASAGGADASFAVRYDGMESSRRVIGVFVLPRHRLALEASGTASTPELTATGGTIAARGDGGWEWIAPAVPGHSTLVVRDRERADSIALHVFVMVPASRVAQGRLNGYRIGTYPRVRARDGSLRRPPEGFIEVTPENRRTYVSPNFRLEQFLCKQAGGYPKYVVLSGRLLDALERTLAQARAEGHRVTTFFVMSGYRTPSYNASLGNVPSSRHQWGEAADIFVDENGDGVMDDLNGDGRSDARDVDVLIGIANRALGGGGEFAGGLGRYRTNRSHGPFLHLDVRGYRARW